MKHERRVRCRGRAQRSGYRAQVVKTTGESKLLREMGEKKATVAKATHRKRERMAHKPSVKTG